jgi:TonB-linked SusC/RagA family outer membrane protein
MKRSLLVFVFFLLVAGVTPLLGQVHTVTGKVTDNSGPLPGVNVVVKGSTTGTVTDIDGKYTIKAAPADVLVFSFIGYERRRFTVGDRTNIDVTLVPKKTELDEVVVVGYGTMKKSDLTGATSTVKVNETTAKEYATVDKMLTGRAAGVQVVSNNGNPGEGVSVRIRGTNSLRGNNEPLYVVDGVVITTAGEGVASASRDGNDYQQAQNGLAGINPADIENIEILKDASATAIYGSRGSNGVVLITTKQGKKGRMKVNGFAITGVSVINKKLDVLNGVDYAKYRNESNLLKHHTPLYYINGNDVYAINYENGSPVVGTTPMKQVNWQDEVYRPGYSYNLGFSVSGGGKKGTYYASGSFNNVGGIVDNSNVQAGNFRINLMQHVSKKLDVDAKVSLYVGKNNFAQSGSKAGSNRSFVKSVLTYSPLVGEDITDYEEELGLSNPYSWINDFEDVTNQLRSQAALGFVYKLPVKGLKIKIRGAADIWSKERRRWYGVTTLPGSQDNGRLSIAGLRKYSYVVDNLLLYNRVFHKKHSLNAMAGYVFDGSYKEDKTYEVIDFVTYEFTINGPEYGKVASRPLKTYPRTESMNSFLTRINYTYNHKYSVTATFRADGSSKFAPGNKYSYFPSFSFAWRISEEEFLKNANALSNLKLRTGWGLTGNQAINPYQTFSNFNIGYYAGDDESTLIAFVPGNIPNPELKWETTSQLNVGLDFGFFNDRLFGSVDGYYKKTFDLLQQIAIPQSTGYSSMLINRGTISNWGIDMNLTGVAVSTKDIYLAVGGNFSINRNKILDLGIPEAPVYFDGEERMESYYLGDNISTGNYFKCPANIFMVGQPIGLFWGWETNGIYQEGDQDIIDGFQPGDVRYVDQNGDGKINIQDRTVIGNPNPDFTYGVNIDFTYKRLSFSLLGYGVYGNDIANGIGLEYYYATGLAQNIFPAAYHEAWRPERPSDEFSRILFSEEKFAAISDRIIEDGSYFRLTNITLGYDIPLEKVFSKFHVYVSAQNLFTLTNYGGYEPNITSFLYNGNIQGVDWNAFPNAKTFMLGLNINF